MTRTATIAAKHEHGGTTRRLKLAMCAGGATKARLRAMYVEAASALDENEMRHIFWG